MSLLSILDLHINTAARIREEMDLSNFSDPFDKIHKKMQVYSKQQLSLQSEI